MPAEMQGAHSIFLGEPLSGTFIPTVLDNLTLSPALEFFDVYEYADLSGVLRKRFDDEKVGDFFDYCIIDTPPTYDAILKNSLEVADAVVIPVVPHHLGVVGVRQMVRAVYQMRLGAQRKLHLGILPVMFNPHINEHKGSIEKVRQAYGQDKLFSPIGIDINLAKQFEMQNPVVLERKRMKGAKDYERFARELETKLSNHG